MSELNEMGNMLMNIALQYTHPGFEDMHQDWKDVCDAGEELVEMDKEIELNDNQKIVLEWLIWSVKDQGKSPIESIYLLGFGEAVDFVFTTYIALTNKEQAQVLKVFAEWGLEQ